MPQNMFWLLLAKKIAGEASAAEIQELEELMRVHPDWHYAAQHIEDIWGLSMQEDQMAAEDSFLRHLNRMKKTGIVSANIDEEGNDLTTTVPGLFNPNRKKKNILAFTLLGVALLASIIIFHPFQESNVLVGEKKSEVITRMGSRTKLVLPDGSGVWLNAGSKLTYNKDFGSKRREVTLTGEAYFEVTRIPEIPFHIQTPSLQVKVLGTSFNIKSYPGEKTSETSVIRGSVEVSPLQRPGEKFLLKPNEKLVVLNESANETTVKPEKKTPLIVLSSLTYSKKDSAVVETSWVENKLVFDDEPFADVALKMERWYAVKIDFTDKEIAQMHLTGSFVNESIQQALEALQLFINFHYKIKQNTVTITK